jgi:hypothetical protein
MYSLVGAGLCLALTTPALASSNIAPAQKFAWTENAGWTNWRDANGTAEGVRVRPTALTGNVWAENLGWIRFASSNGPHPAAALQTGSAFGVNVDSSSGALSGFAWGENVGWINFDTTAALAANGARFDHAAHRLRGWAWGENIGWLNLDDNSAFICAIPADADGDGVVAFSDFTTILATWNTPCPDGDANGDQSVNFQDITAVLANFNASCP